MLATTLLGHTKKENTNDTNENKNLSSHNFYYCNIAAPLTLLTVGLAKHNKQLQKDAFYMVGGYALSAIVTHGAKVIIQRDRPFNTYPDIIKKTEGGGYSLPSGHTSAAYLRRLK